jgi:GntR family transcriptional regulator
VDIIDKSIPTPLYYQLLTIIKEKIEKGVWKPGDTIPTEMEIMEKYAVSRTTVRQAILSLVNDGYLKREKSKGTIVTSPTGRMRFVGSLISFTKEMSQKGISHFSRIIDRRIITANADIAKKLQLQEGDQVYYMQRIRYLQGQPYLYDEHFIPYYLCPGIESAYQENTSLYQLLESSYKLNLHHGQIEFEPVHPPNREMIDILEVHPTTSLILAERIVYSEMEVALDYFKAYIRGKFSIDVVNTAGMLLG